MIDSQARQRTIAPKWRTRAVWLLALLTADSTLGASASDWVSNGPFGGRIQHLDVSPTDSSRLLAATRRGLFGTTDGGATWRVIEALGNRRIKAIAISHDMSPHLFVLDSDGNVLRSPDDGITWEFANGGLPPTVFLEDLVATPSVPPTLYLAGSSDNGGVVFRSTDHGTTWQESAQQLPDVISLLSVAPSDVHVVYAGDTSGNLYKTTDGGQTWRFVAPTGLSFQLTLAVDPTDASTLFAGGLDGVVESTDGGDSWGPAGTIEGVVRDLAVHSGRPSTLYAATVDAGVFRSVDSGTSWQPLGQGLTTQGTVSLAIADEEIFVGSEHGVFARKVSAAAWQERNVGLHGTSISVLVLDPQRPSTVYGAGENGVYKSESAGRSWQRTSLDPRSGATALAIDPVNPQILYAGTYVDAVFKTTDAGASWAAVGSGLPSSWVGDLAVDPSDPTIVYSGHLPVHNGTSPPGPSIRGVYQSLDSGDSWTFSSSGMTGPMAIAALAFDPSDPGTLYAADRFGQTVWKTTDRAAMWHESANGLPSVSLRTLIVDPKTPSTLYVASSAFTGGGVFKSLDGAASWFSIQGDLSTQSINALLIEPNDPATVWAATNAGLFRNRATNSHWELFNEGRVHAELRAMAFREDARTLFVGTSGGGVYQRIVGALFADGFESADLSAWSASVGSGR